MVSNGVLMMSNSIIGLRLKKINRTTDYYVGFIVSIIFSIKYLNKYGINVKGTLIVAIMQIMFQIFYSVYKKVRKKARK